MPEEAKEENNQEAAAPKEKSGNLKVIIAVTVIMVLEAAAIVVIMQMTGGPSAAHGIGLEAGGDAAAMRPVEIPLAEDRYPNLNSGRQNLYEAEVFITVMPEHEAQVIDHLRTMNAQLSMDVAAIFRSAHPSFFQEPTLATLRRQLHAALDERFGLDQDGQSIVTDVLITKCTPIRAGY